MEYVGNDDVVMGHNFKLNYWWALRNIAGQYTSAGNSDMITGFLQRFVNC